MKITWRELLVDLKGFTSDELLSEWRWLVPEELGLRMVSTLGDAFLEDPEGNIYWLDTGGAELHRISNDKSEFDQLRQQPENANEWFAPRLIGDLLSSGASLQTGQCFSYKIPPTISGEFTIENFQPTSLSVHFSTLGQIQRQVKPLPIGAVIDKVVLE